MPYLKVKPDTYRLSKKQMFQFDTCQFCGSEEGHDFMRYQSKIGPYAQVSWKRVCKSCRKTTAVVEKDK